jgi:hypothetical protein
MYNSPEEPIVGTVYDPEFSSSHPDYSSILCITGSRRVLALRHVPDSAEMDYDEIISEQGRQRALRMFDERNSNA